MRDSFKINIVMRIERTNYINSIYNKIGDLTFETINKLIKEGECDAWFSIIQNDINNMELAADIRDRLICSLKRARENLRKSDYEDNNSQTYYMLNRFVKLNNGVRLDPKTYPIYRCT